MYIYIIHICIYIDIDIDIDMCMCVYAFLDKTCVTHLPQVCRAPSQWR